MKRRRRCSFVPQLPLATLLVCGFRPNEAQSTPDLTSRIAAEFPQIEGAGSLFRVDDDYVLQPVIEAKSLAAIRIVPRYFFQETHPNWIEPEQVVAMPMERFRSLLSRLDGVENLGSRVGDTGEVRITANGRTYSWEEYKLGVVERALFRRSPDEPYSVAWFTIWYLRPVSGTGVSINSKDQLYGRSVRIDGKTYWTTLEEMNRVSRGVSGPIKAAGPIGGDR